MKLPAFQFYPADWRKDPGVQALSFHDRGVWFEILCLMHESEQRGKLMLAGQPMPESALARLLGLDKQNLTNSLTTILAYGVASRESETGALICRRMVRDEEIRKIRTEAGKKGGNPALLNQNTNQKPTTQDNQKSTPSSSSSSSSSEDIPPTPRGDGQKQGNLPTSPQAIRISQLYRRRLTTPWSPKEIKAFKRLHPIDPDDLDLVCRYEESEMAKGDLGWHKRDLGTFLNQFVTELDRARAWASKPTTTAQKTNGMSAAEMGLS